VKIALCACTTMCIVLCHWMVLQTMQEVDVAVMLDCSE